MGYTMAILCLFSMHSGCVAIVGRSNVGKSTLLNTLIGKKVAATSFRPQMTRHAIHGVMNAPGGQAVFVDTPGLLQERGSALTGKLLGRIRETLTDVDLILYVVDATREIGSEERAMFALVRALTIPKMLILNKSDLPQKDRPFEEDYRLLGEGMNAVFLLSALKKQDVQPLRDAVIALLPEGEPLYGEDQITNVNKEFWVAEMIREKVFMFLYKEVPYSATVEVESIKEKKEMFVIQARILTTADRYKRMIIGKKGQMIKEIGQSARRELETALNKKVFLDLTVDVDPHWVERI